MQVNHSDKLKNKSCDQPPYTTCEDFKQGKCTCDPERDILSQCEVDSLLHAVDHVSVNPKKLGFVTADELLNCAPAEVQRRVMEKVNEFEKQQGIDAYLDFLMREKYFHDSIVKDLQKQVGEHLEESKRLQEEIRKFERWLNEYYQ